jgi:uncharacterized Ntn-hydrolase superfamily protein
MLRRGVELPRRPSEDRLPADPHGAGQLALPQRAADQPAQALQLGGIEVLHPVPPYRWPRLRPAWRPACSRALLCELEPGAHLGIRELERQQPRTGRLGLGITTFSIAAGGRCEGILAGVGICKTQAYVNRGNDPLAIELLAQGFGPARVMQVLEANDPDHDYRQIAILDRAGNGAVHTGSGTRPWAGHKVGAGYIAFGNVLAGPHVVEAIAAGFMAEPDVELEFRLLAALEGGRDAGGQVGAERHLPERSAAICVVEQPDYPEADVRVDLHDDAVVELRRVLEEFKRYEVFYRERGRKPREAVTQDQFVASLERGA